MLLKPRPVSTAQFSYFGAAAQFVGEVSSTNGLGRVYDDAADEGLTLVSARTGREVVFVVSEVHFDREGDLTHWTLRPATPQAFDVTLVLFND